MTFIYLSVDSEIHDGINDDIDFLDEAKAIILVFFKNLLKKNWNKILEMYEIYKIL